MKEKVKIFRTKDNINIIAIGEELNSFEILLKDPFKINVEMKKEEPLMILYPFLPIALIKKNEIKLNIQDLIQLDPLDDVVDFYLNAIKKYNENDLEEFEDEDLKEYLNLKNNSMLN